MARYRIPSYVFMYYTVPVPTFYKEIKRKFFFWLRKTQFLPNLQVEGGGLVFILIRPELGLNAVWWW